MILCQQFLLEDCCCSSLWLEGFAAWISRGGVLMMRVAGASLCSEGSGSGSRDQSLARVIVGLGCCSRPWSAIPVAASVASASADRSLVDVAGYHPLVFPNKSGFRLKSGYWWIQWGWVSRGGCLRCLVAGASTGSGSSVRRFSAVPLSSTVTSLFRWFLSLETPDPACCALQPILLSASPVVFPLTLAF
ncbi:hypothetical protein IGI04_029741 [Brassica rapa subsp. trilocularis]|uniref:Uncharacterized protein n=1 Tax=Brassica rapa subsp. trilocularis TaxID=1813537 RepID=A0ABQ7LNN9_BRACM|nr:hypothetical protein IGI04_029741 [Brassica rapa subsp. trilocularis]